MDELIVRDSLTPHPYRMRLLLLLLLYPVIVTPQCAPGDINGSCARIKPNQYQLRGVRVKPYWTHVIYGGRDIRRRQSSNAMQAFEKPAMEFNLRPPPTYAAQRLPQPAQRFPLHPVQAQNSFQVSGAVHRQPTVQRRAHGVRSLALNKDPIDSFERAIGGDEFDDRPPIEPIRVIKIESFEVIEPAGPARKIGSNPIKTKKIIQSLTRHMNEVRRPKVIPFSNRDEIINGQIVSQPEVKVTKVEAAEETRGAADVDVSSSEIANGILENILNENSFAKNASELLRVLTNPEQTTTEANEANTPNGTETGEASFEVSTELTGSADNDTDSSFLNFDTIDEKLSVIGSEVDDYGVDEEWEEFSDADGGSTVSRRPRPSGRVSTRRTTAASITSTTATRGSIITLSSTTSATTTSSGADRPTSSAVTTSGATTSTITTSTTTTAPQSEEAAPGLESDLDESEEELPADDEVDATTATTSASSTSTPASSTAAEEEESDKSSESSEESSDEEETTAATTTTASEAATTTTSFDDGFREAVKAQQAEVLGMRREGGAAKGESSAESKNITELNSETIKSIEKERKKKKRTKKIKKEEVEEDEDDEKDKEKTDLPEGVEQALRQNLAGIQGDNDDKKEKKKVKKEKKTQVISEDVSKTVGEVITENLGSEIDSISKEDNENKEQDEEADSAKEDYDEEDGKSKKRMKKKGRKEEEDKKDVEDEEEPVGGGAQPLSPDEENTLRAEIKNSQETTVTIKKPRKGRGKKTKGKKEEERKKEDKQEEENAVNENEEENNDEKKQEETKDDEENDDELEVTTPDIEDVEDDKPEIAEEDTAENAGEEKPTKKKEKKGKEKKTKKKVDEEEEEEKGDEEEEAKAKPPKVGGDNHDIRTGNLTASLKDAPNAKYYYPPKVMVPLPSCFYNPSGYVCCNLQLNNLIEDTFEEIKNVQGYSACNIAKVANIIQQKSEQMFEHPFESIVALSDFAQNVHFAGDLVCKVEIDGKYMLTYATPYDAEHAVEAVGVAETPAPEVNEMRGKDGKRKAKKPNKAKKKSLPIHNFRM